MRRFLSNCLLLAILFTFFNLQARAQEISAGLAKDLIRENSTFLNFSQIDIENSLISNAYVDKISGAQLIYLQQSYKGVPVFNSIQVVTLKNNRGFNVNGNRIQNIEEKSRGLDARPTVSAKQAVFYAARSLNMNVSEFAAASLSVLKTSNDNQKVEFALSGISQENIVSHLLWVPDENSGKINLAWQVKVLPPNSSDYWLVFIDAKNGVEINRMNLTLNCSWDLPEDRKMHESHTNALSKDITNTTQFNNNSAAVTSTYTVIPFGKESPSHSSFIQVTDPWLLPGAVNNAATLGWHNDGTNSYKITRGNNVWAKVDTKGNNDNTGAPATSTTDPNLNFNFAFDANAAISTANNRAAAVTNLFYWNNVMHDLTYQYGFDELSGNFQKDNQGRGGLGNDFVYADAQDGSGKNNANFATGIDGSNPRMQMFLFTGVDNKLFKVNTPPAIEGYKNAIESGFSTNNLLKNIGAVTGDIILYQDNAGGTIHQACGNPVNTITGKIALIDRGDCAFTVKVKNAQSAGAIAVVVANNDTANPSAVIAMGGTDNTITIPAVMISFDNGHVIKNQLANNVAVNVTLKSNAVIDLDGDFDNGIIAHEYGHGVSNRLTGGPSQSTCLQNSEQAGEGWSDYLGLMTTTDWATAAISDGPKPRAVGTYVLGQDPITGTGIRKYPYSTNMAVNPWTYEGVKTSGGEVHDIGEIWAATLWDMTWNLIQMDGINPDLYNAGGTGGNSVALKLVMMGMKLQVCRPGFLDSRDGILKADQLLYNGKYSCAIWKAFARRGMGVKADQGNTASTTDQVQNFDIPSGAIITKSVDKEDVSQNEVLEYTFTVRTLCEPIVNYNIIDTLADNVIYISGGIYNAGNRTVSFNVANLAASDMASFKLKVKVQSNSYFAENIIFSETVPTNNMPASLVATSNVASKWSVTTLNHSAPYGLKTAGPASASEQILTSADSYAILDGYEFSFWHSYNLDSTHDGSVVELSIDNGTTWLDAGPYMSQNGYNSSIISNTNLLGKRVFTGTSAGPLQTIINLSDFAGKDIKFRLRFVSDARIASNGWYVDDILIMKRAAVHNVVTLYNDKKFASQSGAVSFINAAVLPLSWGVFTAEKSGSSSLLKWSTLQEVNTEKFVIERSTDGIHFNQIGNKNAAGNSNGVSNYSLIDDSPFPGVNNYRIKQTDLDGNYSYSEIRSLIFDLSSGLISISPNPSKGGKVMLKIAGNQGNVKVTLLNTAGQILNIFDVSQERNDILLPTLASGIYYLKITGEHISSLKKLVIKK